jgi:hypothetical protein
VARLAIATHRLSELPDGRIAGHLRHPWSDGTTRVVFEPQSFLEKLAALIPPLRAHLVTYHDVLRCCHRCGGRREVLALITESTAAFSILECLGLSTHASVVHPARGPPELF